MKRRDTEVFTSVQSESNPFIHGPSQLYRIYEDKVVTPEGKLLAYLHQNKSLPGGKHPGSKVVPVEEK